MSRRRRDKKKSPKPAVRRWTRDLCPPRYWRYKVMVSSGVEQALAIDEFERLLDTSINNFIDDDFVEFDREKTPPDRKVNVVMIDIGGGDMKKLMMLLPLLVGGKKTVFCQLTTECKGDIIIDPQYLVTPGMQRLQKP